MPPRTWLASAVADRSRSVRPARTQKRPARRPAPRVARRSPWAAASRDHPTHSSRERWQRRRRRVRSPLYSALPEGQTRQRHRLFRPCQSYQHCDSPCPDACVSVWRQHRHGWAVRRAHRPPVVSSPAQRAPPQSRGCACRQPPEPPAHRPESRRSSVVARERRTRLARRQGWTRLEWASAGHHVTRGARGHATTPATQHTHTPSPVTLA